MNKRSKMIRLAWLSSVVALFTACTTTPCDCDKSIDLDANALVAGTLGPKPAADYVSAEFSYAPFEVARVEVEKREKLALKNRGEAHITLISPPEFKTLLKKLSAKEIRDEVAANLDLAQTDAKPICVGRGVFVADQTWFVVIEMPSALRARRAVATLFEKKGGETRAFKADEYYPHVTLGFTTRDLHLQDGVVKDVKACRFPIHR